MFIHVNRAPILTLWATVVAEQLGYSTDTALTLGRAVAGYRSRAKIGRVDTDGTPVVLLDKVIRLLPDEDGALRAAVLTRPTAESHARMEVPDNPAAIRRYLSIALGEHLEEVWQAMRKLAACYSPDDLNQIGLRLYEQFRPDVPSGKAGRQTKAMLEVNKIRAARRLVSPNRLR